MLLNLVFWFLGGSGTGLVPPTTNTTTLTQYSSSLLKGLSLLILISTFNPLQYDKYMGQLIK